MSGRRLVPFACAIALATVLLPLGGAQAAFNGYKGSPPDIAYDNGANVKSSRSPSSFTTSVLGTDPTWRPDAQKIAYVRGGTIWTADANGSNQHDLGITGAEPAWNLDGSEIAYVKGLAPNRQIYTFDISSNGMTASNDMNRSQSGTDDIDPAWSSSGQIAFARKVGGAAGHYQIFVMGGDGSNQLQLTSVFADDVHPAFSPDSGTLAFQSDRSGNDQIYAISAGGGNPTRLTSGTGNDLEPSYSPEGDAIAFVRQGAGIYTLSLSTSTEAQVTSGASDENPDYRIFPPHNISPPSISGPLQVGSDLSADPGEWIGAESFDYQWMTCTSNAFSSCSPNGGTGSTYTIAPSDEGKYIEVDVVAHNSAGDSAAEHSSLTGFVGGAGPLILELPEITVGFGSLEDAPTIDFSVFASTGTWQSNLPLTYKYQWRKCERNNGPCSNIDGATSSSLLVTGDLVGRELVVGVTAHNDEGDTYIESKRSLAVTGTAPHSRATPPIFGTNEVGETLSVNGGLWTGSGPITFSFDWRRCDAFGELPTCVSIPGATQTGLDSEYTLQPDDLDYTIRVYITARNTVGSTTIITNHTFPTLPKRKFIPEAFAPPSITGVTHPGKKLTASLGSWSGDDPIAYKFFWRRCNATTTACVTLTKAKRQVYSLTKADLGRTFIVVVSATNDAGTTVSTSAPTDPVSLLPKRRRGRRVVGTSHADYIAGGAYDDVLIGGGGNDTIKGGNGNDVVQGNAGDDVLDGGGGLDKVSGGPGSDTIFAADGVKDSIDCGPGSDRVIADPDDVLKGCEAVDYSGNPGGNPGDGS